MAWRPGRKRRLASGDLSDWRHGPRPPSSPLQGGATWSYRGMVSNAHPSEVLPLSFPEPEGGAAAAPQIGLSLEPLAEAAAKTGMKLAAKEEFAKRVGQVGHPPAYKARCMRACVGGGARLSVCSWLSGWAAAQAVASAPIATHCRHRTLQDLFNYLASFGVQAGADRLLLQVGRELGVSMVHAVHAQAAELHPAGLLITRLCSGSSG